MHSYEKEPFAIRVQKTARAARNARLDLVLSNPLRCELRHPEGPAMDSGRNSELGFDCRRRKLQLSRDVINVLAISGG